MRSKITWLLAFTAIMIYDSTGACRAAGLSAINITPAEIQISTFYSGQKLDISGTIPAGHDVFVEIEGPAQNQAFNRKGKVGPLWMNTGKVKIEHAPFLYLLLMPQGKSGSQQLTSMNIGLQKLKSKMTVTPTKLSRDEIFDMFVRLKHSEGLYDTIDGAVSYGPATKGRMPFKAVVHFPSSIAPDDYRIIITLAREDIVEDTAVRKISVKEVGVVKLVRRFANHRELVYGIACVIIALAAGLAMGLVFKGGGGH